MQMTLSSSLTLSTSMDVLELEGHTGNFTAV